MSRTTRIGLQIAACCTAIMAVALLIVPGAGVGILVAMVATYALVGVSTRPTLTR